jgi:hypothetical protein
MRIYLKAFQFCPILHLLYIEKSKIRVLRKKEYSFLRVFTRAEMI